VRRSKLEDDAMNDRATGDRDQGHRGDHVSAAPQEATPGKASLVSQYPETASPSTPAQTGRTAGPAVAAAPAGPSLATLFPGAAALTGKVPLSGEIHQAVAGKDDDAPAPQLRMAVSCVRNSDGKVVSGHALTGLGKTTVAGPTALKSGSFSWVIQWVLDKPSPKGGCIVQGVHTTIDVKDDKGAKVDVKAKTGVNPANWPLWELWEVNKGQKVTTYAETGDTADDTYAMPAMGAKTKGTISILGSAEFYEGLAKPATFKPTPGSPAGILPIVRSQPTLAGGTGAISHNLTATWDSTAGDETTTVAVT
jgi:hypothetical protein